MDKKERKVQGHAMRAEKKVGMYSLENDEAHSELQNNSHQITCF